jgi:hypothetical protein
VRKQVVRRDKKTVVSVVLAGKVEILPMRLKQGDLTAGPDFQIAAVQFRMIGKAGSRASNMDPFSHLSHRQR